MSNSASATVLPNSSIKDHARVVKGGRIWHQSHVCGEELKREMDLSERRARMELFLTRARELGDRLQAEYGLFPEGTAAEIIRELRENRP